MQEIMRGCRRGILCIIGAAWASAMGGCTTLPASMTGPPQEVDYAKVDAIERLARARGVSVLWLRYPTKAATAATVESAP